jgi:hypothetical protein
MFQTAMMDIGYAAISSVGGQSSDKGVSTQAASRPCNFEALLLDNIDEVPEEVMDDRFNFLGSITVFDGYLSSSFDRHGFSSSVLEVAFAIWSSSLNLCS